MYRDASLEVTPSLVVASPPRLFALIHLGRFTEVPVQDIARVCRDFDIPSPRRRRWRSRRERGKNCLILALKEGNPVRVSVAGDDPARAYRAVRAAMDTEY